MKYELEKIENGDFTTYPFLGQFVRGEIPQFSTILKRLILNLNVRFFNVSFSLDKKKVKDFLNYEQTRIMPGAPVEGRERCGIFPLLDVFNMREALVPLQLSGPLSHLGLGEEWSLVLPVLTACRDNIVMSSYERENHLSAKEKKLREDLRIPIKPNLLDVFKIVEKTSFPRLWRFVLKSLSIMPTSVACEQSFSYFKRSRHKNMGEKTAKTFLFVRLNHYETDFNLM